MGRRRRELVKTELSEGSYEAACQAAWVLLCSHVTMCRKENAMISSVWKADGCTGERYRKGRERGDNVLRAPYLFIHSLVQETASEPDSLLGTVYTKTKKKCA